MEYPEYPDSRYCAYPMRVGVPQYYLDLDEANAGKPTWRKEYACTPNGSRHAAPMAAAASRNFRIYL